MKIQFSTNVFSENASLTLQQIVAVSTIIVVSNLSIHDVTLYGSLEPNAKYWKAYAYPLLMSENK